MHARLFPKVQDGSFLEAREIARRVIEALPSAVVDWQRGEVWVAESLQRLIDMRTPEVILQGHRRFFGRTVHISLAYPDWPERPVELITSGIQQGLDALFLNVTPPFNLTLLEQGAADFAAALARENERLMQVTSSPWRTSPLLSAHCWPATRRLCPHLTGGLLARPKRSAPEETRRT
jgi:hypothetical protein